jgi:hypothetical protein
VEPPRSAFARKGLIWVGSIVFGIALVGGVAAFSTGAFFNPLRTLRKFPVQEYYDNHSSLEGTRFRAELTIAGQIGWKENLGRLVNCNLEGVKSPVVVLLSPKFDSTPMEAGEHFQAELLVAEGGLIKVNFLSPN